MTKDEVKDGLKKALGEREGMLAYKRMKKIYQNDRLRTKAWGSYVGGWSSLSPIIHCFATWANTEQGDKYWRDIASKVR